MKYHKKWNAVWWGWMVDTLWNRLSLDANIIRNYCLLLFKTNNRPYRESNLIDTRPCPRQRFAKTTRIWSSQ